MRPLLTWIAPPVPNAVPAGLADHTYMFLTLNARVYSFFFCYSVFRQKRIGTCPRIFLLNRDTDTASLSHEPRYHATFQISEPQDSSCPPSILNPCLRR